MKKITAVIVSVLVIACLFAGCGGMDSGKVTDTTDNNPVITTDNMTDGMSDSFEDGSVSDTTNNTVTLMPDSDSSSTTM